ncbi:DUF721 domain-containing protein [Alloscardovia criceti]|uniref:DUF721 domain-containing protein n=1 Tax=Alloscardovia criceti TaxID=356828 RepID=UPI000379FF55|nr:DUF721 domain-containing protein [Alloscardovia criceti]
MQKPIAERFHLNMSALAAHIFEPYAHQFVQGKSFDESNQLAAESFGQKGRDWVDFGSVLAIITNNPQWKSKMDVARLYDQWPSIVGEAVAYNSRVGRLEAGVLTIYAISPAWATQLSYMTTQIIENIQHFLPSLDIQEIRIIGPQPEPFRRKRY